MAQPNKGSAGKPNYSVPVNDKSEAQGAKTPVAAAGVVTPASKPGFGTRGKGNK